MLISVGPSYGVKEWKKRSSESEGRRNLMLQEDGTVLSMTTIEWREKKRGEKKGKR